MSKEKYLSLTKSGFKMLERKKHENFFEYKKESDQIWQDLGWQYLEN